MEMSQLVSKLLYGFKTIVLLSVIINLSLLLIGFLPTVGFNYYAHFASWFMLCAFGTALLVFSVLGGLVVTLLERAC